MAEPRELVAAIRATERTLEELQRRSGELPGEIESFESQAQAARDVVTQAKSELEAAEKLRRDREADLQDTEAQRDKFQGQTAQVKTNEEYTALLREIDRASERISGLEEEILTAMETADDVASRLAAVEDEQHKLAGEHSGRADQARADLARVEKDLVEQSARLTAQASELEPQQKALFERSRRGRGTGTSLIDGETCSGCHRDVPFEDINRVLGGEVLPCTHCGRFLVPKDPE